MKHRFLFWTASLLFAVALRSAQAQSVAPASAALVNVQMSMSGASAPATFTAAIEGTQENPAVTTSAKGTGVFRLDANGLSYRVTVDGLSGPITASHFHNGAAGVNAGVVREVKFDGNTASGTWGVNDATQPLTPALINELKAGRIYFNVHTAANPGGEIRGQVAALAGNAFWADVEWGQEFPGPASVTPAATATAPTVDRVGYPENYKTWKLLYEFDRQDNRQHRATYANDKAASATPGQPYPYGSIVVLETQATEKDPLGNVMRDANGRFIAEGNPTIFAMRREQGFGTDYKDIRNGEWEYAQYRADKSRVAPNATTGGTQSCATCHIAAGEKKDFVFRNGLDFARKSRGTGVFWMDGSNLRYRITVSGMSSPITQARFFNAVNNANGPAVQALTLDGATASGAWAIPSAMRTELTSGRLYVNFQTTATPDGEVRGQILPVSVLGGLEIDFSRAISGRTRDYAWKGVTDDQGKVTIGITAKDASASGYYAAHLINTKTRAAVSDWISIPVRGGRSIDLQLQIGGPAAIVGPFFGTPITSATKPATGPQTITVLPGILPQAPSAAFGAAETKADGTLDLPVHITDARDLFGGDLTLTYDPQALTFQGGRIGDTDLTVTKSEPGRISLSFEGLPPADQAGLTLTFARRSGDRLGDLNLTGFWVDRNLIPIGEVATEAHLSGGLPDRYALFQNAPNPFNPATTIRYAIPQAGKVRLTVYNALGQEVARLVDLRQEAGNYAVTWDARNFASGVYYYRLEAGTFREVKRLVLLK